MRIMNQEWLIPLAKDKVEESRVAVEKEAHFKLGKMSKYLLKELTYFSVLKLSVVIGLCKYPWCKGKETRSTYITMEIFDLSLIHI